MPDFCQLKGENSHVTCIQLETQQAQGEGEENARREIRTRKEILKKESDFKYFLLCFLMLQA